MGTPQRRNLLSASLGALTVALAFALLVVASASPSDGGAIFLVIDEDSIDNGNPPNFFSDRDVNDHIARLALRTELPYFASRDGSTITLHTGTVGDEGWFAPKTIPTSWNAAGPTPDGVRNFVGNPSLPYPHNVGRGLGRGSDPEKLLDKIPNVTPSGQPSSPRSWARPSALSSTTATSASTTAR
jgi:hypothetical protein